MIAVESSAVARLGYDDSERALYYEYKSSGRVFCSAPVDRCEYEDALAGKLSIGRFLNELKKSDLITTTRVEADVPA